MFSKGTDTMLCLSLFSLKQCIYSKTIIRFSFCDIRNNQRLGECYHPRPWFFSSGIASKNLIKLFFLGRTSSVFHFFKRLITHLWNYKIFFYIHQVFRSDSSTRGKKAKKSCHLYNCRRERTFDKGAYLNSVKSFLSCSMHFWRNCEILLPFFIWR